MALIPTHHFKAIVGIGKPSIAPAQPTWMATGFLYGHLLPQVASTTQPQYRLFLVTNRHVFQNQLSILLRFDNSAGGTTQFVVNLMQGQSPIWTGHPDVEVDVAVLPINGSVLAPQVGGQVNAFTSNGDALFFSNPLASNLSEGDGVFVMGFPLGLVHPTQNLAIVRGGVIARIKDCLSGGSKSFLIDAQTFPGNSGGPVILKAEIVSIQGTQSINTAHLLGVVSGYIPYREIAVSTQTGREKIAFEENSGLAIVFPVDKIQDTILISMQAATAAAQATPVQTDPPAPADAVPPPTPAPVPIP